MGSSAISREAPSLQTLAREDKVTRKDKVTRAGSQGEH